MSARDSGGPATPHAIAVDAGHRPPRGEIPCRGRLTVLIASPDRDYLWLARTVLRSHGHIVFTTSIRPERVRRQVRLRRPDVVLLDSDPDDLAWARESLATLRVALLGVHDDPRPGTSQSAAAIGKWVSADALADAVARAVDDGSAGGRRRLRVVDPR